MLNKIKKYSFYSKEKEDVEYHIYSPPDPRAENMPFPVEELKILNKLVEWNAIKIKEPKNRIETVEIGLSNAMHKLIVIPYIEILEPKFSNIYNEYQNKNILKRNETPKTNDKVKKITIIKLDSGKNLIAVNSNYSEAKSLSLKSNRWKIFIKEVEEKNFPLERKTSKGASKEITDYFNYNTQKCPIYFKGKYKPTNIFSGYDSDTLLNPDIKTEIINEKSYNLRLKRGIEK